MSFSHSNTVIYWGGPIDGSVEYTIETLPEHKYLSTSNNEVLDYSKTAQELHHYVLQELREYMFQYTYAGVVKGDWA